MIIDNYLHNIIRTFFFIAHSLNLKYILNFVQFIESIYFFFSYYFIMFIIVIEVFQTIQVFNYEIISIW